MQRVEAEAWEWRPILLAVFGAMVAFAVQQLIGERFPSVVPVWRVSLAGGVATAGFAFGFTAERLRLAWAAIFAVVVGLVAGLILYWDGSPGRDWFWDWPTASLFLSIAIAAPLFQVARNEGGPRFRYGEVHAHAWTNIVLWCAAWLFLLIVFALAYLLSELFALVGVTVLRDLLRQDWFRALLAGAALGGAIGLLRERDTILRTLQRVVTAVLSVLAPILGVGLILFLAVLPFTGLGALWSATRATTPILLSCVIGGLILANAVIGDGEADDERRYRALWIGATLLAVAMLPLAMIAAIATGLRIGQYGLSPDRLWGLAFVVIACAYGLSYLVAVVRGRREWAALARRSNLVLGVVLCGLALILATPILSFNALSTHDQVARLKDGRVTPEKFDWAALAFDFGGSGRTALSRLARSIDSRRASPARQALAATSRWDVERADQREEAQRARVAVQSVPIIVRPVQMPVPPDLRRAIFGISADQATVDFADGDESVCRTGNPARCVLFWRPGQTIAVVMGDECAVLPVARQAATGGRCSIRFAKFGLANGRWTDVDEAAPTASAKLTGEAERASLAAERAAIDRGDVAVRDVTRRQLFVGGKAVGDVFE